MAAAAGRVPWRGRRRRRRERRRRRRRRGRRRVRRIQVGELASILV
jgi:hypothetical protein